MHTNLWGNGTFRPHRVVRSTRELSDAAFDYVVCANKITTSDCSSMIKELAHVISPKTTLVSVQNGIGVEAPLSRAFKANTILSAICYISCLRHAPGIVQQVSHIRPHAFHIGAYNNSNSNVLRNEKEKLDEFVALDTLFKKIEDVQAERWIKQILESSDN
jgi:2-dehydropantoate 2-reductase